MTSRRTRDEIRRERHETLLVHERELWAEHAIVAGLDEVGAGPWAGPLYAACVVLDPARVAELTGVDDSKRLSELKRSALAVEISKVALASAVIEVSVEEVDRFNVRIASMLGMERALRAVQERIAVTHVLVDAHPLSTSLPQRALPKGDATSLSIAAASILAKVARDERMTELGALYPHHGFERHMGYGTEEHRLAIERHGLTPLHRRSFAPIRAIDPETHQPRQRDLFPAV